MKKAKKLPLGYGIKKNKKKSSLQICDDIKRSIKNTSKEK